MKLIQITQKVEDTIGTQSIFVSFAFVSFALEEIYEIALSYANKTKLIAITIIPKTTP